MIRHDIYLPKYDWRITAYYCVTSYYIYEILDALRAININKDAYARAYKNLFRGEVDTGLTFSNAEMRESVMVIGYASSADEYANSIAHETQHVLQHIGREYRIDPYGEEICYLAGDISGAIRHRAHSLLCEGCLSEKRAQKTQKSPKP